MRSLVHALMCTRLNIAYAINILNNFHLAIKEAVYLTKFVRHLLMVPFVERPIVVMYDNTHSLLFQKIQSVTQRLRYHYIREVLKKHATFIERLSSKDFHLACFLGSIAQVEKESLKFLQNKKYEFLLDVISILEKGL